MHTTVMDVSPWRIYYDKNATQKAYDGIDQGCSEECGCDHCQNFIEMRQSVYPKKVLNIFQDMGIDYNKESEVFHLYRTTQGLHDYGGWFLFIGSVECIDSIQKNEDERLTHYVEVGQNFSWSFSNNEDTPHHKVFNGSQLALVHFSVKVPWVIKAEEPT